MSKAGYIRNEHVFWVVECTFITNGKKHVYHIRSVEQKLSKAFKVAKERHCWSWHPTFEMRVVGVKFE
jgi:hypothetical protein